jgi:hypothetical protein
MPAKGKQRPVLVQRKPNDILLVFADIAIDAANSAMIVAWLSVEALRRHRK